MELVNRSLRAFRGFSDEPILPAYKKDSLDGSPENCDPTNNNSTPSPETNIENQVNAEPPLELPADDVMIDFRTEGPSEFPQRDSIPLRNEDSENSSGQRDLEYEKVMKNIIDTSIYGVLKWNTVSGFICVLAILMMGWNLSGVYILLLICLADIYNLLSLLYNKPQIYAVEKGRYTASVIKNTLSVTAKMSLIVYDYIQPFHLTYSFAPTILFDLTHSILLAIKYKNNTLRKFYSVRLLLKATSLIFISSIILKIDHLLRWYWKDLFFSFWVLVSILSGIALFTIFLFLYKLFKFFTNERHTNQLYGAFWLVLVFTGASTFLGAVGNELEKYLEHRLNPSTAFPIFIMATTYNIIIVLYTTLYFKQIQTFFRKLAVIEDDQDSSPNNNPKKQPANHEKVSIPLFLTRSSNTFFRKATQEDIERTNRTPKNGTPKSRTSNSRSRGSSRHSRKSSFDSSNFKRPSLFKLESENNLMVIPETDRDRKAEPNAPSLQPTGRLSEGRKTPEPGSQYQATSRTSLSSHRRMLSSSRKNMSISNMPGNSDEEIVQVTPITTFRKEEPEAIMNASIITQREELQSVNTLNLTEMRDKALSSGFLEYREAPVTKRRGHSLQLPSGAYILGLSEIVEGDSYKESGGETTMSPSNGNEISAAQQCLICFDKHPDAVFMECGHGGLCYECSIEIWKTTTECYLCRKKINQVLQIDHKLRIGRNIIQVISSTQMVLNNSQVDSAHA